MDKRPVLFIDSGIGGLLYCNDFIKRNSHEEVCYLADRVNFPYGQKKKEELSSILITLTEKLLKTTDPKIIVLACNTATVSALDPLRRRFPKMHFVETVPAIKPAPNASKCGKVGILGTARTIEDPYNQNLANECEKKCEITGIAAPDLVKFVEERFDTADEKEKREIVKKYIDLFRAEGVDALVLGCTHFLYLLEEFQREASPFIRVFDSLDGITKRIEYLLDENNGAIRTDSNYQPVHRLILTGTEAANSSWKNRAESMGFALYFLHTL
jgi:glutamate racemase